MRFMQTSGRLKEAVKFDGWLTYAQMLVEYLPPPRCLKQISHCLDQKYKEYQHSRITMD